MKFLANENFPQAAVLALRQGGHDVLWCRTDLPGVDDDDILRRAQAEDRVLLTFDKDFGDLAFHWGLPARCGVILFRIAIASPDAAAQRVIAAIAAQQDWSG
jgi:predicted nuclease of predicted toxin-antitoxin system